MAASVCAAEDRGTYTQLYWEDTNTNSTANWICGSTEDLTSTGTYTGNTMRFYSTGSSTTWAGVDWTGDTTTSATGYITFNTYDYDLHDEHYYVYANGELIKTKNEIVTEDSIEEIIKEKRRQKWIQQLREKRLTIKLQKAENRGLTLLERLIDQQQVKSYLEKGYIDINSLDNTKVYRIFKDDSQFIKVYEKKPQLVVSKNIKEALTTAQKMKKMDEFVLNGETFILKRTVCTHHRNQQEIPQVDAVISKIIHLRSNMQLKDFGNVYEKGELTCAQNEPIRIAA